MSVLCFLLFRHLVRHLGGPAYPRTLGHLLAAQRRACATATKATATANGTIAHQEPTAKKYVAPLTATGTRLSRIVDTGSPPPLRLKRSWRLAVAGFQIRICTTARQAAGMSARARSE